MPDVSILPRLADVLSTDVKSLLSGKLAKNEDKAGNMSKTGGYTAIITVYWRRSTPLPHPMHTLFKPCRGLILTFFSVHTYDNKDYFFPSVEAGKYREKDDRVLMPLSITCHHAATNGYHVDYF